jgi:Mrp family chromosome partitioning ATPase
MGKVYEALNKAERQLSKSEAALLGIDEAGDDTASHAGEEFDFMQYSLAAPAPAERERFEVEAIAARHAREALTAPARELSLDQHRVDPHLITFNSLEPAACEQYNKLAITLMSATADSPRKRVLIASAQHGEGRTVTTLNLACALARAHKRVLVVDCDTLRPSVLRLLGAECETGLHEAISGEMSAGAAIIKILPQGFNILPLRAPIENAAGPLSSTHFAEMLDALEPNYDFILFDSPPLLKSGAIDLLVKLTDTAVLVIHSGKTTPSQLARAIAPMTPEGVSCVLLNRVEQ